MNEGKIIHQVEEFLEKIKALFTIIFKPKKVNLNKDSILIR